MKRILAFLLSALLLLSCIGCAKTAGGGDALSDALNNAMQGRPAQSLTPAPKPAPTEAPPASSAGNGAEALARLCAGIWVCQLEYDETDDDALPINGYLFFDESGSVRYEIGYDTSARGEAYEIWKGFYDLIWDEGQKPPAGTIEFAMELTDSLFEFSEDVRIRRADINASYRLETDQEGNFTLYLEEGDSLYILEDSRQLNGGDDDPRVYHFEFLAPREAGPNIWGMTDEELMDYLLAEVPEANENVTVYGLGALVTGEITELPGEGSCRDVWLGTDHGNKFTKELLYTVCGTGAVYFYDAMEDEWVLFSTGYTSGPGYKDYYARNAFNTLLAYVKLDKTLKGGSARLLIDEVRWVDDEEEPNDYRIENDVEEWVPYTAYEWTQCYLWFYVSVVPADLRFQVIFDDFIEEIEWRSDGILANVIVVEGDILIVSEVYTP